MNYLQLKTYQRNLRRIIEDAETRGVNADVYKKRFEKATKNLQSMLNDVVKTEPIMTNDSYVDFTLLNAHRTYLIDNGLAVDPQINEKLRELTEINDRIETDYQNEMRDRVPGQ